MELTNTNVLIATVSLAVGVVLALLVLFPLLKKKGVKTDQILGAVLTGVKGVDGLTDALKAIFPQNAAISIIDKIIDYAKIGVQKAEQLYYINEITGDQRKQEALKFVYEALEIAGIEVTPEVKAVVDGCIEAAVLALGHSMEFISVEAGSEYNGE